MLADGRLPFGRGHADGHGADGTRAGYHRACRLDARSGPFPAVPADRRPLAARTRCRGSAAALGGRAEIWIKREDLLPLAFGGNKLRNLEMLVGAALADGADSLVTAGRRWSNHARLTAAAGARAGLEVHLVLSGPPTEPPNPGVRLDELLGATVHQAATADGPSATAARRAGRRRTRARGSATVRHRRRGGRVVGAVGQVVAALELLAQAPTAAVAFDRVVVPSATGGTQAGLLVGLRTAGAARPSTVWRSRPADELRPPIAPSSAGSATSRVSAPSRTREIELDDDQLGDGYGRPTDAADEATALLARTEGDPRRSDLHREGAGRPRRARPRRRASTAERVVFWHAGGTPGLFEPLDRGRPVTPRPSATRRAASSAPPT